MANQDNKATGGHKDHDPQHEGRAGGKSGSQSQTNQSQQRQQIRDDEKDRAGQKHGPGQHGHSDKR